MRLFEDCRRSYRTRESRSNGGDRLFPVLFAYLAGRGASGDCAVPNRTKYGADREVQQQFRA